VTYDIPFNRPPHTGNEEQYVLDAMRSDKLSGDGPYGVKCQTWFEEKLGCQRALLTPSCTHALEMAAILIGLRPGDEVIVPSYTFVSTANAFALRGATVVFVDIRPDTLNIDEKLIEAAITPRTRAIVPVHYAGVACEMDAIMDIAKRHDLYVIEDAAQGFKASYKGRPLGAIGHLGVYSFHETKNITSGGEGGLLIVNEKSFTERAEIIREKGTNRSQFFRGMVDKYSWVDIGSSYLPSEIQAAYLWGQLQESDKITDFRRDVWAGYIQELKPIAARGLVELPTVPAHCIHNGHMLYLKASSLDERTELLEYLKNAGIYAVFHYVPLHNSPAGLSYSRFHGEDIHTSKSSDRVVRLPLFYGITEEDLHYIVRCVKSFYDLK
tara:strand:+ start:3746 stop:4891 length:1146 start_codon:yes stop_codon:yes gene_type:complete